MWTERWADGDRVSGGWNIRSPGDSHAGVQRVTKSDADRCLPGATARAVGDDGWLGRQAPLALILAFWLVEFASLTARQAIMEPEFKWDFLFPRFLSTMTGVALSLVIAHGHRRAAARRLHPRLAPAILFALLACVAHSILNLAIFELCIGFSQIPPLTTAGYGDIVLNWFWFYAALSALLLRCTYGVEFDALQQATYVAQLRALRYQLNPHFMFNTLNSIAALINRRDVDDAEKMVLDLSDFLRAAVELDPGEDIELGDELALQTAYLAIEKRRFGDRLRVIIEATQEAKRALVPSLIIQPLAENVIRHAVMNSIDEVTFSLTAFCIGDRLHVRAANTAPSSRRSRPGTGIGLANVEQRLRTRHGARCAFAAGPLSDGGFCVDFTIPFCPGESNDPHPGR